jgi:hypothetical protein
MAVRAFRNLTFVLFLVLSVVALTVAVPASSVRADGLTGGAIGVSGDPDQPKDTGPRIAHSTTTSSSAANASSMTMVEVSPRANESRAQRRYGKIWSVVEILMGSYIIGRPGLLP